MSDYYNDALVAKEKLATVSESFCLAKWKQVSLHLTTGHTNSCYHLVTQNNHCILLDNPKCFTQH